MGRSVRTAAAVTCAVGTLLVVTVVACTGVIGTQAPSPAATATADPVPSLTDGASTAPEPTEVDSAEETAPSAACPLSAAAFADVIGSDTVYLSDDVDYGYPGDMMCYYWTARESWNVYVIAQDGILARSLRPGIESRFSDVTPFDADGAENAVTFEAGRSAIFDVDDLLIHVQGLGEARAGVAIDLARAIASLG